VLLFSFEGLGLLQERMANGPLIAEVADSFYDMLHEPWAIKLSATN
jgi:hypothetical protein